LYTYLVAILKVNVVFNLRFVGVGSPLLVKEVAAAQPALLLPRRRPNTQLSGEAPFKYLRCYLIAFIAEPPF
jgi:hypothetical protein